MHRLEAGIDRHKVFLRDARKSTNFGLIPCPDAMSPGMS